MIVEVRPLPMKKWHGKAGKESFSQSKVIEVLYDLDKGVYATGLTDEEVTRYEELMAVRLDNKFNASEPHPYWSSKAAQITLPNHTVVFDTSKPVDYVKVKNLKASNLVANSQKEYDEGLFPKATHVIFDEEQEVSSRAVKVQLRNKAVTIASKMSKDEKVNIIQILSNKSLRGRTDDFIDVELDSIITEKTEEFIKYSSMDKKEAYTRAAILEAIQRNILVKEGSAIYYMSELIGLDFTTAVEWFTNPQNSKMKGAILEKVNN